MRCLAAAGVEKVRTIREEVMKSGWGGVSLPCVSCYAAAQMGFRVSQEAQARRNFLAVSFLVWQFLMW